MQNCRDNTTYITPGIKQILCTNVCFANTTKLTIFFVTDRTYLISIVNDARPGQAGSKLSEDDNTFLKSRTKCEDVMSTQRELVCVLTVFRYLVRSKLQSPGRCAKVKPISTSPSAAALQ